MLNDQVIADNHALIARNRELECELARLNAKLGRVARIADELHESAAELVESYGDEPMSKYDARLCSFKSWMAEEIREVMK